MLRKNRNISDPSMGQSRKNNGNVKRSPRVILKKLTEKEVAELQSGLLESCSKDLTITTEIVHEQNPTSNNLTNQQKFDDSGDLSDYLIEENGECMDEISWWEEEEDNQSKNAVSSECDSSKCDQTINSSYGNPGHTANNNGEDIHCKMQENKLKPEVKNSVRESGNDDPNENYKLPLIYMKSEGKMVAKLILRKMTEEDIANFTPKPKQSQTATETEKLGGESRKKAPEQDVGVEKDTTMLEFDRFSSDSEITDSNITRVIRKIASGRGDHKRTPVDSDSDAILSSSDDDDYDVKKEIHKTSLYARTNSGSKRQTTLKPKQSRTATETEKLSGESRKEAPKRDVGVEKDTTMPEIDRSSSNSDSASTDSEITYAQIKKRKRGRAVYKRTPVDSDSDAILSSSDDDYDVEKEIHKTSSYDRTNSGPKRRTMQKPKQSQTATETEKLSGESQKEASKRDVGVEKDTTMPEVDRSSSDSASTDSELTCIQIKKRKRGRGAYKRTPVDSDPDAILSSSDDDDYNVKKEIHKTTSYDHCTTSAPNQQQTWSRCPTKKRGRLIESSDSESEEEMEERKRTKKGKGIDKNRKEMPVHVENFAR